jgi:hypothetical protein
LADALRSRDEWFSAADGLRMAEGLLAALRSGAAAARSLRGRAAVVEELRALAVCLRAAAERGARFRLEIG